MCGNVYGYEHVCALAHAFILSQVPSTLFYKTLAKWGRLTFQETQGANFLLQRAGVLGIELTLSCLQASTLRLSYFPNPVQMSLQRVWHSVSFCLYYEQDLLHTSEP